MRTVHSAIIAGALLLSLSACTQTSPQPSPSGGSPLVGTPAPPPAPPRSSPSTGAASSAPTSSAPVAPTAPSSSTAAVRKCRSADLKGALSRNDGAGGTNYFDVSLTNVSSQPCTLQGYPQVLAVDKAGKNTQDLSQIGQDAGHRYWDYHAQAGTKGPRDNPLLTVAPGAKAYFQLSYPSIYNYATGELRDDPYKQTYTAECGEAKAVAGFFFVPSGEPQLSNGAKKGVYISDPTGPIPVCFAFKKPYVNVSEFVSKPTTG